MQRESRKIALLAAAPCLITLLASPTVAAQPSYDITDLGTLYPDDQFCQAFGTNSYGQAAGFCLLAGASTHAFLWTPDVPNGTTGHMIDLGASRFGQDGAYKVNSYGQVLFNADGAYLWTPDTPNGTTGSSTSIGGLISGFTVTGYSLNGLGQVVGYGYPGVCFLWTPDVPNGTTGQFNSYGDQPGFGYSSFIGSANGVNDLGQVTGAMAVGFFGFPIIHNDPSNHYVTDDIFSPTWDPASQDYSGYGNAISDLGHVAGTAVFPGTGAIHPILYDGSAMLDISDGGGGNAFGINSSDEVVGSLGSGAFLYTGGTLYYLNDLISPSAGWSLLSQAFDINESGQIVGHGLHNRALHPYLMTPQ
ncbi:MAG TPA: hypothetical protein VKB87_08395 [Myxococcaceae bacterium]|nr:hypothetical protein [Myxococcaceae bacterium]